MTEGSEVLHFKIVDTLGSGGMGIVYRAHDTRLGRIVALKFLPDIAKSTPDGAERLLAEARAAAKLDHPNIGAIFDIEQWQGRPFIVMALYEGENLRRVIERGPLEPRRALDLAAQAAKGLAGAHGRGIVHRDVKPENLFLTVEGTIRVLDFGLAKHDGTSGLTSPGVAVGTLAYMAPEQVRGQDVDARADVWALGVVLYEMLSGSSPFVANGGVAGAILRIVKDEPQPIETVLPGIAPSLARLLGRCLAKDPAQRYPTARELLADLEQAQRETEVRSASEPAYHHAAPEPKPASSGRGWGGMGEMRADAAQTDSTETSRSPTGTSGRLPARTSPLVGRQEELEIIALNLASPDCRMLTLLGPGGAGKTRLALEAAHEQATNQFPDGVWFLELDAIEDTALLPQRILDGLGLQEGSERDPVDLIIDFLVARRCLLVLDNFEQLMPAVGLVDRLATDCPDLKLLITSRERLAIPGEWVLPVTGLVAPNEQADEETMRKSEAVRLFEQCARRADLRFSLADDQLPHAASICRLVAGSPLALELAASWLKMVDCGEIAAEIRSSLDFLSSSGRVTSERHRSVRASFEYSWRLLNPVERQVLARLSIFRGHFSRSAAASIAGARLPLLASLMDKSLLQADTTERYRLHPLIHAFTREKLVEEPGALAETEDAHGIWYHSLLAGIHDQLRGSGQADAQRVLSTELDNILAAWEWAVSGRKAEQLAASSRVLDAFFDNAGRSRDALRLFTSGAEAIERHDYADAPALAELLARASFAAFRLGRYDEARRQATDALDLLRNRPFQRTMFSVLNSLGAISLHTGDLEGAREHWLELRELAREHGDPSDYAVIVGNLGSLEYALGNYQLDRTYQEEALAIYRRLNKEDGIVSSLSNLAHALATLGDDHAAQPLVEEAIERARANDLRLHLPRLLGISADLLQELGQFDSAQARYLEVLELADEQGDRALEGSIRQSLGRLAAARGDDALAASEYARSLALRWEMRLFPALLGCLLGLAELYRKGNREQTAQELAALVSSHSATEPPVRARAQGLLEQWRTAAAAQPSPHSEASIAGSRDVEPIPATYVSEADLEVFMPRLLQELSNPSGRMTPS